MTDPTPTGHKASSAAVGFGCLGVIALLVFFAVLGSQSSDTTKGNPRDAYLVCQKFVRSRLKSPDSAKFPHSAHEDVRSIMIDENRFLASAYVDAQNVFGAMLRTRFTCEVTWTSGTSYHLERLEME